MTLSSYPSHCFQNVSVFSSKLDDIGILAASKAAIGSTPSVFLILSALRQNAYRAKTERLLNASRYLNDLMNDVEAVRVISSHTW